jgi:pyruvate formate lyase activating enzyme
MKFSGIQRTSLIDYPDNISTVLFTYGCNLRCPYCHNWRIVIGDIEPQMSDEDVIADLEIRKKFIDHVVVSGGEPTLQPDLPRFLFRLKNLGFKLKLDSNGLLPEMLQECLPYLDYVAVDVKTSIKRYPDLGVAKPNGLIRSIDLLRGGVINYEFRCTVAPGFVDDDVVRKMGEMVKGAKTFVFQQYRPEDILDSAFTKSTYSREEIGHFADLMKEYVDDVKIRI